MSQRAVTALVFFIAGLLAVVILVGLAQRTLDATGMGLALCSLLTGTVGGVLLRNRTPPNGGDDK